MEGATATANGTSAETATVSNPVESSSSNQQITELAMNLLVQGRRHLLVSDIPSAISALAESSRLLVELYGEFADECAESYYYYGMALLEMARTDCDVLGDAVDGGDKAEAEDSSEDEEEGDDDEEEDGSEEDEESKENGEPDAKKTNGEAEKKPNGNTVDEPKTDVKEKEPLAPQAEKEKVETKPEEPADKSEDKENSKETSGETSQDVEMKEEATEAQEGATGKVTNGESTTEQTSSKTDSSDKTVTKPKNESKGKALKPVTSSETKSGENGNENGNEEDITDDVSNLQLAWEVFELAKNIYQRKAETDPLAKPKLADALIRLAEVAIESENYTSAIEDLRKCLDIQTASFPDDSRSLAETHYQLGVAYTFTTEFKEAVRSFEAAASVIQRRIENLKNPVEKKPSMEEPRNLFHTIEGEIEELETLLPDIREKIADTIDLEKEAIRKLAENGTNGAGPSSSSSADPVTPASSEAQGSATNGGSPDSNKPATDITHLIRKKRKPEDATEAEGSVAKKICAEAVATETA